MKRILIKNTGLLFLGFYNNSSQNAIKHLKVSTLRVILDFKGDTLNIMAKYYGIGFSSDAKKDGIGLINIKKRSQLIGAEINFESEKNKGTSLEIHYKL
ncbi:hypothetical protein [Polaribacter filamentus]|uniref:hypothetical protein n=1 Tax=Polaribacter filamentus TaxID=53483 RepID=UPI001F0CA694|nr:hypothetical protein [Polaribacter filamentus]